MRIMIAYDHSRNAVTALQSTIDMFKPLKPLIMLVGVVEESLDTSSVATSTRSSAPNSRVTCAWRPSMSASRAWMPR